MKRAIASNKFVTAFQHHLPLWQTIQTGREPEYVHAADFLTQQPQTALPWIKSENRLRVSNVSSFYFSLPLSRSLSLPLSLPLTLNLVLPWSSPHFHTHVRAFSLVSLSFPFLSYRLAQATELHELTISNRGSPSPSVFIFASEKFSPT